MKELLGLAKTRDEYLLVASFLSCMAGSGLDMGVYVYSDECRHIISDRLSDFRRLPASVDSYDEINPECPAGEIHSPASDLSIPQPAD